MNYLIRLSERPRDFQRARVYKAEEEAFRNDSLLDSILPSLEECEKYVRRVVRMKRLSCIEYAPDHHSHTLKQGWMPVIKDARGSVFARALGDEIRLPHWARKRWVILHELTHLLMPRHLSSHGWEFCATYLKVVQYAEGREVRDRLKAAFQKHRVRFRHKRKVTMTPERRIKLADQMAAMGAPRRVAR
jgi:putative metallohydrolase (TIGR04338 family)